MSLAPRLRARREMQKIARPSAIPISIVLLSVFATLPAFSDIEVEEAAVSKFSEDSTPSIAAVENQASEQDGPTFSVGRFTLDYREPNKDHPSLADVFPKTIELQRTETGFVSPRPGAAKESVTLTGFAQAVEPYHASALATISRALLRDVQALGLLGVYVQPSTADIAPDTEANLRAADDFDLDYEVWTGRIKEVRTIAVGQRVTGDWVVDHKFHSRIRNESPLQSELRARGDSTDLLKQDVLEDYLFRLNRHPGRHVEAALASSADGEGVALDYRVHEPRSITPYIQVANTGTSRTDVWQGRIGFVHRQLTNNDDILNLEYLNAGWRDLNGIHGSYEAPWFGKKRPRWMKTSGFEPSWLKWFDRDKLPWWGSDRLRWRVSGGFSRVEIGFGELEEFGVTEAITKDWNIGGQLIHQTWQHKNWFVDTFVGGRIRRVDLKNTSAANRGELDLVKGIFGAKLERSNDYSRILGTAGLEVGELIGNDEDIANQSRTNADDRWVGLFWNFGVSHYLEPLIDKEGWEDPTTEKSSTLAHEVALSFRGQYAFNHRLIPQLSQVIGGLYSVRGFKPGEAVGDSVYVGSAEYRFHLPRALPIKRIPLDVPFIGDFRASPQQVYGRPDWDLVIRTFLDAGYADREGNSRDGEFDQFLLSAGIGLEANFMGKMSARFDWARGIAESHSNSAGSSPIDKSGKFHFLFSVTY